MRGLGTTEKTQNGLRPKMRIRTLFSLIGIGACRASPKDYVLQ